MIQRSRVEATFKKWKKKEIGALLSTVNTGGRNLNLTQKICVQPIGSESSGIDALYWKKPKTQKAR